MVAAGIMAAFEAQLQANLLIAFFVPGILYLADAVGTQTEALATRGLSVGVGIRRVAPREALTGLLVGVHLGAMMFPAIAVVWGDVAVAATVALAVMAASAIATLVALALPWLLHRLGRRPAVVARSQVPPSPSLSALAGPQQPTRDCAVFGQQNVWPGRRRDEGAGDGGVEVRLDGGDSPGDRRRARRTRCRRDRDALRRCDRGR